MKSYSLSSFASLLYSTIFSFLLFVNANSFDDPIHFRTLKTATGRSMALFYVNEFGAKGDGITDDTKVTSFLGSSY